MSEKNIGKKVDGSVEKKDQYIINIGIKTDDGKERLT